MNELNNIRLNAGLLTSLYRTSLVDLSAKKIMVAVKSALNEHQREFLMQILSACKLTPDQVTVVNTTENGKSYDKIVAELAPHYVLSFGAGSGTELFRMENSGGTRYLNAPALDEMMQSSDESKLLKRKTWGELKSLFNL